MKHLADFPDAHLRIFERPALPPADSIRDVYLIGICGTGMGSLAGLLRQAGYRVRGSDAGVYPPMSTRLAALGIPIHEGFDAAHLDPAPDLVIVGNACVPSHPEAAHAREMGLPQLSLPEALAQFFIRQRRSLVVAGTHGKTTTTGMLVHLFREQGLKPGFLVGGVMRGMDTSYDVGGGRHFIVEGDEYDSAYFDKQPKFMHYRPTSAIVTSMEFDHADIYDDQDDYREAFERFVGTVDSSGILALWNENPAVRALAVHATAPVHSFGLGERADIGAVNVRPAPGGQRFELRVFGEPVHDLYLPMSGRHNLLNALAAITLALGEGLDAADIGDTLATFQGMKRRLEILGEVAGVLIVDDFAHHPTAVAATIGAIRERWRDRRLIAIFEPRSNSSRRKAFAAPYAKAFDLADHALLSAPPFRHNDDRAQFLDPARVVDMIESRGVPAEVFSGADRLLPHLLTLVQAGDVVLIMSNGGFGGLQQRLLDALAE